MARIYIAAPYANKSLARGAREQLHRLGHTITSQWLDESEGENGQSVPPDPVVGRKAAETDLADIRDSDTIVVLTDNKVRGTGHHTEVGFALAIGLRLVVCGPITSVFQYLGEHYESLDIAIAGQYL